MYLLLFREQAGKFEYAAFYTPATVTAGTVDGATVYSLSLRFPVPDPRDRYRFMVLANLTDDEFAGAAGPDGSNFKAANGTADPMETIRTGITYAQPATGRSGRSGRFRCGAKAAFSPVRRIPWGA